MDTTSTTPENYLDQLPAERQAAVRKLRETVLTNLPEGFTETMSYGMIGYVVPHSLYPAGYHANPSLPLPFINLASQKNHVVLYHMGLADPELLAWFADAYPQHSPTRPDVGKSCIRFKKTEQIPYELIGQLVRRMSVGQWISLYEESVRK